MSSGLPAEPRILPNPDLEEVLLFPFLGGRAAVFGCPSPGREGPNQDSIALIPIDAERGVAIVADGLGGRPGGHLASSAAVHEVRSALERGSTDGTGLREAILDGFENANRIVTGLGVGAATTLAVIEIAGDAVRPYHVGDSMALVVGQKGRIKLQTIPHGPVGYAIEAGLLDEKSAMSHEDRHLVNNMIGSTSMRIEIGAVLPLAPRDTLVVASDGLFDNLRPDEVAAAVRKGPLEEAARGLVRECRRRMDLVSDRVPSKPDDLSFVLYRRTAEGRDR